MRARPRPAQVSSAPSNALDEHRAALAAADADCRDTAAAATALQHAEQVQRDACTRCANRMPQSDRAAVDVEPVRVDAAERARQTQLVAAECIVLPRAKTGDHLRGECLVDLPGVDIAEAETVAREQRRGRIYGAQSHLRGIERRPLRIDDASPRHETVALDGLVGGEQQPCRPVGDLRAVACRDVAILAVEKRPEPREVLRRRILAYAVVCCIDVAAAVVQRNDLAREPALALRGEDAYM